MCKLDMASIKDNAPNNGNVVTNKKWILQEHPDGKLNVERNLAFIEKTLDLSTVELKPDQVLIKTEAFSVDAFVRTMLNKGAYHGIREIGSTIIAQGYGTVIRVGGPAAGFKVGTHVTGMMEVANYCIAQKNSFLNASMTLPGASKPSLYLGLFGLSGLTAYFGMFKVVPKGMTPKKGDTVVVSAAAGAVGSIAAQLAKLAGARVVGIAGGKQKQDFLLQELQLDGAIDYKDTSTKSLSQQLDEACPKGIDFFFDNVGGETLSVVLEKINRHSCVVICGAISQYNTSDASSTYGPKTYIKLAEQSSIMVGYNVGHYLINTLSTLTALFYLLWHYWMGNLKAYEHVEQGIEKFGRGLDMLFTGGHKGRLVIQVDEQA